MSSPGPNVIVFFTDQQRWDSTGLHGNPLDLTPNLDRLASHGTHLEHFFTCQPVCGPARSCLQTGQYATTTGVFTNGNPLPTDRPTLATCFRDAGYRTGYIGKWHLAGDGNPEGPVPPDRRGGYQDWFAAEVLEMTSDPFHTSLWDGDGNEMKLPGYRVDAETDLAIRYCTERAQEVQPFMLFMSFLEPHHQNSTDNYPAPPGYEERYAGRWTPPDLAALGGTSARHLPGYWSMVRRLDEALGRLMDALYSLGIADNTIVLFTSDHGCHFKTRKPEYKRSCHDSSIRVPTAFWGPGFDGGGRIPNLTSLVDLPPTLLDAAGIPVPDTMEGRSILPLLRRSAEDWPDDVFVQISGEGLERAIRTRRWKYNVRAPGLSGTEQAAAEEYEEAELYDLKQDPWELDNLITSESHSPARNKMRERLLARIWEVEKATPRIVEAKTVHRGQRTMLPGEENE